MTDERTGSVPEQKLPAGDVQPTAHRDLEPATVNVRSVLVVGAGMVVLIAVSMILMAAYASWLTPREKVSPAAQSTPGPITAAPGQPGVDPNQPEQRRQYEAAERQRLSTYGWVDRKEGIARIPIERAMEILSQRAKQDGEGSE